MDIRMYGYQIIMLYTFWKSHCEGLGWGWGEVGIGWESSMGKRGAYVTLSTISQPSNAEWSMTIYVCYMESEQQQPHNFPSSCWLLIIPKHIQICWRNQGPHHCSLHESDTRLLLPATPVVSCVEGTRHSVFSGILSQVPVEKLGDSRGLFQGPRVLCGWVSMKLSGDRWGLCKQLEGRGLRLLCIFCCLSLGNVYKHSLGCAHRGKNSDHGRAFLFRLSVPVAVGLNHTFPLINVTCPFGRVGLTLFSWLNATWEISAIPKVALKLLF